MIPRWTAYAVGALILAVAVSIPFWSGADPEVVVVDDPTSDGLDDWACPSGSVGRLTCAYAEVPLDYADPEIERQRILIGRLEPPGEPVGPPIVFLGHELGGYNVGDFGEWQQVSRSLGREIVLVELRGNDQTEPSLSCPVFEGTPWLDVELSGPQLDTARGARGDALAACAARLSLEIPLAESTFDATVRDIDAIRELLGIERWSLLAGGDVNELAVEVADRWPDTVESLILLGAESADATSSDVDRALEVINRAFDEATLAVLERAGDQLAERPIVYTVTVAGRTQQVLVSDEVVYSTLAVAAGNEDVRPSLPTLITDRLVDEQWRSIAVLRAEQYPANRPWSAGAALANICSTAWALERPEPDVDGDGEGRLFAGLLDDPALDPGMCESWPASSTSPRPEAPSAPVLVINGVFDHRAPESALVNVAERWPTATTHLVERGQPSPFDECVIGLVAGFLGVASPGSEGCEV